MKKKQKLSFTFILLFLFLSTTLFIHFLHTEEGVRTSHSCAACNFQKSAFSTDITPFFILPQLTLLESLQIGETFSYFESFRIIPSSRSPPQI